MSRLERELAALPDLDPADTRMRWAQIDDRPPPNVPAWLLRSLLAAKLQERRYGALPNLVRRELERLPAGDEKSTPPGRTKVGLGARLVREWNGRTIVVEVLEKGFRFDGRTWRSLSEIARHVTGSQWSGPRFFGLVKRG